MFCKVLRGAAWAALLLACGVSAAPLPVPYEAVYEVSRNGKPSGELVTRIVVDQNRWTLSSETTGTRGMARVLGIRSRDVARGSWVDGEPVPAYFEHHLKLRGPDQRWSATFDRPEGIVRTATDDGEFRLEAGPDVLDPASLQLAIRAALSDGKTELPVRVVDEDELDTQTFVAGPAETVDTVLGCRELIPVKRIKPGSSRYVNSWHDPALGYLALRIDHGKEGGDHNSARLVRVSWNGQAVPTRGPCGG